MRIGIVFSLFIFVVFPAKATTFSFPTTKPTFACEDGKGAAYSVWIDKSLRVLHVAEGGGRQIALSSPGIWGSPPAPGEPIVYYGLRPGNGPQHSRLDLSTEFVTHYRLVDRNPIVEVSLMLDYKERRGLACRAANTSTRVVLSPAQSAFAKAGTLISEAVRLRDPQGEMTVLGLVKLEGALQRIVHSPGYDGGIRADLIATAKPALRKMTPKSASVFQNRLSGDILKLWTGLMQKVDHAGTPETDRYLAWASEGFEKPKNLSVIRQGFAAFGRSKVFYQEDIRRYFEDELRVNLKTLTEAEVGEIQGGLSAEPRKFLAFIWGRAVGKRTLASYPQLEQILNGIERSLSVPEAKFDPSTAKDRLMAFFSTPYVRQAEATKLFYESAVPLVKRMTARQREDVMVWLSDKEKKIFNEAFPQ